MYGANSKFLDRVKRFYSSSKPHARMNDKLTEWFVIKTDVKQGYVVSAWLFNVFCDVVLMEIKNESNEKG